MKKIKDFEDVRSCYTCQHCEEIEKKKGGVFIQEKQFRIGTEGEKKEITYKGLQSIGRGVTL